MEVPWSDDYQLGFFGTAPSAYWPFAEYHEDPEHQDDPEIATYTDTGVTLRAAIPWADASSRLSLLSYSGSAQVWDARVYCFRPTLSNFTFQTTPNSNISEEPVIPTTTTIIGNILDRTEHPPLKKTNDLKTRDHDFNCSTPSHPGAIICPFGSGYGLKTPLKTTGHGTALTFGFMIFKLALHDYGPPPDLSNVVIDGNRTTQGWSLVGHGPWTTVVHGSNYKPFSTSACYTIPMLFSLNLTMSGAAGTSEARMGWSGVPGDESKGSPDTLDIRRQLGVTWDQTAFDSRGILALDPTRIKSDITDYGNVTGLYYLAQSLTTLGLVNHNDGGPDGRPLDPNVYMSAKYAHTALFRDILNTTDNPAYAIQALSTTLYQMQYFDSSYRWTRAYPATYVFFQDMSTPKNKAGLCVVVGIVAAHVVLVGITVAMFLLRTRASLLGNIWQSVAQVVSERTTDILWTADSMTDKEVKKALSGTAYEQEIKSVGLIRRRQNGRNEFGSLDN